MTELHASINGVFIAIGIGLTACSLLAAILIRGRKRAERASAILAEPSVSLSRAEERYALCMTIACRRFGALPKELEPRWYQSGVTLSRLKKQLATVCCDASISPRDATRAAVALNTELAVVEGTLDAIARHHATLLGWSPDDSVTPWDVLEEYLNRGKKRPANRNPLDAAA